MRWTIGAKLGGSFALALSALVVIGFISFQNISKLHESTKWVDHTHEVLASVDHTIVGVAEAATAGLRYALTRDARFMDSHRAALDTANTSIARFRSLTQDNPTQQRRITQLERLVQTRMAELNRVMQAEGANALEMAIRAEQDDKNKNVSLEIRRLIAEMRAEERSLLAARATEEGERTERTQATITWGMLGVILFLVCVAMIATMHVARPLSDISRAAQRIAGGDIEVDIAKTTRADEVGELQGSFQRMTHSLRDLSRSAAQIAEGDLTVSLEPQSSKDVLASAFVTMKNNLRRSTADLREAAAVLAASASEILAGSSQVAASAAQTATAVTQTTTTVEEVKQTAQLATQKARLVSETAAKAAQTAQEGRRAVEESIEGMQRIREQMASIAETVVKLSEQSQAIGDIVATVADIAEQSNLLAVNAAIEAARAGEQGRGFSVVAQEVKSLADQSKHATAQVRSILNDIQKAIASAVMATEQGSKSVEVGVTQSHEANEAIRSLAGIIDSSAQAAMQIAASSQQQSVGMDQVAAAMDNIKRASVQNVTGTKQTEVAAKNLYDVGQKLKDLVERYKV